MKKFTSRDSGNIEADLLLKIFIGLMPVKWGLQYYYHEDWPGWLSLLFFFAMYLIVVCLIIVEKYNLEQNHIDKVSFFGTIIFGAFLRPFSTEIHWLGLVLSGLYLLSGVTLLFFWIRHRSFLVLPQKLVIWSTVALIIGMSEYFLFSFMLTGIGSNLFNSNIRILYFANYQLSNIVIPEELFFRGFLWQGLKKRGHGDHTILLTQAVLFMLGHINIFQPQSVLRYLSILIGGGVITGILAWKSKSVFPGIVFHTIHNTMQFIFS